jgi:hypothetical protein
MEESKLVQDVRGILTMQDQINTLEKQMLEIKNKYGLYKKCDIQNPYNLQQMIDGMTKDKIEAQETFLCILRADINIAKSFLNHYYKNKEQVQIDACFECLMNYPDELANLLYRCSQFTNKQLKCIWDKHGEYIYKKVYRGYNDLKRFCNLFKDFITDEHRNTLVKRILGRKLKWEAETLIDNYKQNNELMLKEEHIKQLEGFLVAERLRK